MIYCPDLTGAASQCQVSRACPAPSPVPGRPVNALKAGGPLLSDACHPAQEACGPRDNLLILEPGQQTPWLAQGPSASPQQTGSCPEGQTPLSSVYGGGGVGREPGDGDPLPEPLQNPQAGPARPEESRGWELRGPCGRPPWSFREVSHSRGQPRPCVAAHPCHSELLGGKQLSL